MNDTTSTTPIWRPAALGLIAVLALIAMIRVLPDYMRPMNFVPIGALCLFAGARLRGLAAIVLPLSVLLLTDVILWDQRGYPIEPMTYVAFGVYIALGAGLLRRTESPTWVTGAAFTGSILFFVITNFYAWVAQAMPYPQTFAGLMTCYEMGIPFYTATFMSDLMFSYSVFAAHAYLTRAAFPQEQIVPQMEMTS